MPASISMMPSDSQYLWSTAHSMIEKPPTMATALSVWISLWAKPAIWAGLVCSVVELVRDRVAVDAAVVVDAVEVRLGHVGAVGEVGARLLGDDRADLDRRPRGLRARLLCRTSSRPRQPSRWSSYRRRRCSTWSCRCCCCRRRQRAPTGRLRMRAAQAHVATSGPSQRSSSRVTLLLLRRTCCALGSPSAQLYGKRTYSLDSRAVKAASAACLGEFARRSRGHRVHLRHTP